MTDVIQTIWSQSGDDALLRTLKLMGGGFNDVERKAEKMQFISGGLSLFGAASAAALAGIGTASLKASGDMESIETGMLGALGSMDKVNAKMAELEGMDKKSSFNIDEISRVYLMLQGAQAEASKIVPLMKAIGNGIGQAGRGSEAWVSAMTAIQQTIGTGKLEKGELNQLVTAGLSPRAILMQELGMSQQQLNEALEQGTISAEQFVNALISGYNKGQFAGAMERQAEILNGKLSTLDSSFIKLKATIGDVFNEDATKLIGGLTGLIDKTQEFSKEHPNIVKTVAAVTAIGSLGALGVGGVTKIAGAFNELSAAKEKLTGKAKGALGGLPNLGGGAPQWDPKAQRWRGAGGRFVADDVAQQLLGGMGGGTMTVNANVVYVNGSTSGSGPLGADPTGLADDAVAATASKMSGFLTPKVTAFGASLEGAAALGVGAAAVGVTLLAVNDMMNSAKDMHLSDEDYAKKRGVRGGIELDAARGASDNSLAKWWRGDNAASDKEALALAIDADHRAKYKAMGLKPGAGDYGNGSSGYPTRIVSNPAPPAVTARQERARNARNQTVVSVSVANPYTGADYEHDDRSATSLYGYDG